MILYRKDIEDRLHMMISSIVTSPLLYDREEITECISAVVKELNEFDRLKKLEK